jgi:hypothetical protein
MNMLITRSVLEAHLQCKYKAYLRLTGENGSKSDYQIMLDDRRAKVRRTALAKMQPPDQEVKVAHNTLLGMALLKRGVPYLFDVTAKTDSLEFHFDGLKKLDGVSRLGQFYNSTTFPSYFMRARRSGRNRGRSWSLPVLFLSDWRDTARIPGSSTMERNVTARKHVWMRISKRGAGCSQKL